MGIEEILENIYSKVGDVNRIEILGDYARGIESGVIEILIIGDNIKKNIWIKYSPKLKKINRKVNFFVSNKQFKQKFNYF